MTIREAVYAITGSKTDIYTYYNTPKFSSDQHVSKAWGTLYSAFKKITKRTSKLYISRNEVLCWAINKLGNKDGTKRNRRCQ